MNRCSALTISSKRCKLTTSGKYCRFHVKKQKKVSFSPETKFVGSTPEKPHKKVEQEHKEENTHENEHSHPAQQESYESDTREGEYEVYCEGDTREGKCLHFILCVLYVVLFLGILLFVIDDLIPSSLKEFTILYLKDKCTKIISK
jgi:hypothetical protein